MAKPQHIRAEEQRRFRAPFVLKLSFYVPSPSNQSKNAAHIGYIATRPGAEMSAAKTEENIGLLSVGSSELQTAAGHVKYAHERPGSHGLFSSTPGENLDLKGVQQELNAHQGVVWRTILSLREEDAKRLDFTERGKWEDALRASVPEAAAKMGIGESNLRWVAAFHQEQGHPHVHLVMWEKHPQRKKGVLSKGERIDVKRVFMKHVYAEEQTRLFQEKTVMRDLIRDMARGDTGIAVKILDEVQQQTQIVALELQAIGSGKPVIAPKAYSDDIKSVVSRLDELSKLMPRKGRAVLQYLPEDARLKARAIADHMLHRPAWRDSFHRYMDAVEEMTRLHTLDPEAVQRAKSNAYADLRDRVANVVVKGAARLNRSFSSQEASKEDGRKREYTRGKEQVSTVRATQREQRQVANEVWKSVWRAMEQARMQFEAQNELMKREDIQSQQRIRNQREQERD